MVYGIYNYSYLYQLWYNYGIYNELVTGANLNQQTSLGGLILHGCFNKISSGWWYTYPSEKSWSSSVGIMTFPISGKS